MIVTNEDIQVSIVVEIEQDHAAPLTRIRGAR